MRAKQKKRVQKSVGHKKDDVFAQFLELADKLKGVEDFLYVKDILVPKQFQHFSQVQYRAIRNFAYHEAGHAALCYESGWPVKAISIILEDRGPDLCPAKEGRTENTAEFPNNGDKSEERSYFQKHLVILFAGYLAEHRFDSRCKTDQEWDDLLTTFSERDKIPSEDYVLALDICKQLTDTEDQANRLFRKYRNEARKLIETPIIWDRIEKIAKALLESPTLSLDKSDLEKLFPNFYSLDNSRLGDSFNFFPDMSPSQSEYFTDLVKRFPELYPGQEPTILNLLTRFNELHPSEKLKVNPAMKFLIPGLTE